MTASNVSDLFVLFQIVTTMRQEDVHVMTVGTTTVKGMAFVSTKEYVMNVNAMKVRLHVTNFSTNYQGLSMDTLQGTDFTVH